MDHEGSYTGACLLGRLTNKTILPKVGQAGQFFFGVALTGELENLGRLTVILM